MVRTRLRKTDDVVAERTLRRILGLSPGKDNEVVAVCAGEWRKEPSGRWRFWADRSWDGDVVSPNPRRRRVRMMKEMAQFYKDIDEGKTTYGGYW